MLSTPISLCAVSIIYSTTNPTATPTFGFVANNFGLSVRVEVVRQRRGGVEAQAHAHHLARLVVEGGECVGRREHAGVGRVIGRATSEPPLHHLFIDERPLD